MPIMRRLLLGLLWLAGGTAVAETPLLEVDVFVDVTLLPPYSGQFANNQQQRKYEWLLEKELASMLNFTQLVSASAMPKSGPASPVLAAEIGCIDAGRKDRCPCTLGLRLQMSISGKRALATVAFEPDPGASSPDEDCLMKYDKYPKELIKDIQERLRRLTENLGPFNKLVDALSEIQVQKQLIVDNRKEDAYYWLLPKPGHWLLRHRLSLWIEGEPRTDVAYHVIRCGAEYYGKAESESYANSDLVGRPILTLLSDLRLGKAVEKSDQRDCRSSMRSLEALVSLPAAVKLRKFDELPNWEVEEEGW